MPQNIPAFFDSYADLYNRALAGEDVFEEIMDRFSDKFLAAGPDGVSTGKQGSAFHKVLEKGYRFYRQIGTQKMTAKRVEVTPIDAGHSMAKVFYRADYKKPDGSPLAIDFDITYLLDTSAAKPKIFAFIAGDEMEAYRKHGLLPDNESDRPTPRIAANPRPRRPKRNACTDWRRPIDSTLIDTGAESGAKSHFKKGQRGEFACGRDGRSSHSWRQALA
jgi:hypothetical protein